MPEPAEVQAIVLETVRALAQDFDIEALRAADAESPLFGDTGPLDSMALVNLIADLEDAVATRFGQPITLADERAMSAKRSPFRDVPALTEAVLERLV